MKKPPDDVITLDAADVQEAFLLIGQALRLLQGARRDKPIPHAEESRKKDFIERSVRWLLDWGHPASPSIIAKALGEETRKIDTSLYREKKKLKHNQLLRRTREGLYEPTPLARYVYGTPKLRKK